MIPADAGPPGADAAPPGAPTPSESSDPGWSDTAPGRSGARAGWLLGSTFVALVVAALLAWVPLPYVIFSPGPVTDTLGEIDGQRIIDISGAPTHPTTGALYFTTVRMVGGPGRTVTVYDLLAAKFNSGDEIADESAVFPEGATEQSVEQENVAEMEGSQQVAAAVAQRALGKDVKVEVYVASVVADGPSKGIVEKGDVILSVDGQPTDSSAQVRSAVVGHRAGEAVELDVRRGGVEKTVRVVTREDEGRAVIGIAMGTRYQLPIPVTIHAGAVGGPSAGMMFTLAIYDLLTQGQLTGGAAIAGTGTMADDGSVGPIGGVRQKMIGAKDGGADWFLAPTANCSEVVDHIPQGLHVVKVTDFRQALHAVEAIADGAGAQLPACAR